MTESVQWVMETIHDLAFAGGQNEEKRQRQRYNGNIRNRER
jgi:hypothetical protein